MLLVVLGALVGFGIGRRAAEGAVTSAKGDLLRSDRERFTAETLHRRLLADNEALERALSEPIAVVETAPEPEPGPVLESIRAIMRLQDAKVTVRVTAVLAGKISAEFAALYGLTDADVARLNDAIRQAHAEFKEPVVTAANVSMVNGAVVVMVPASDDGAKLRQKVLDEFAATLGPERYAALTAMSGLDSIDRDFDAFGSATRQITISAGGPILPGMSRFQLMDTRRTSAGGSIATMVMIPNSSQLPEKYRWLAPVMPALADLRPLTGPVNFTPPVEKK